MAFALHDCRPVDPTWCEQKGFKPNKVYRNKNGEVFLVLWPSARSGDYALNKASLDYLAAAPVTGTVVLLKDGKLFLEVPVQDMAQRLNGVPPREGTYGPFWWINDKGQSADDYYADAF